ncbi:MAG: hypothetical protein KDI36_20235, partial [Pseudomonadales bacterium]|nr:hypothetical protein [Pseudomonadales bacterium]
MTETIRMSSQCSDVRFAAQTVTDAGADIFTWQSDAYDDYALQWCVYSRWTLEEAANLLSGCVPHRPMFLRGDAHYALDEKVLEMENRLRRAIGKTLSVSRSRKYFSRSYLNRDEVLDWAEQEGILQQTRLPEALRFHRRQTGTYTTPQLEAAKWLVENFWQHADLRDPPSRGQIIHHMLQAFPELSGAECEQVESL